MRWIAVAIVLVAALPARADDGYYGEVSSGPVAYEGDLAPLRGDTVKVHVGFGVRRGAWSVELTGGGMFESDGGAADCPADVQCRVIAEAPWIDLAGANLRHRWQLGSSRWQRLGVFASLYGGPRVYWGDDGLAGYHGTGIGGGVRAEITIWAIGYYVDLGSDALRLVGPGGDSLFARTPYITFGGKIGWL